MRRLGSFALFAIAVGASVATPERARASAADTFGLGSEESAVCGASAARVHDFSAGYYDPAGLALVGGAEFSIGVLGQGSQLQARTSSSTRTLGIAEPFGIVIGAAAPVPLGAVLRDRLFVGIALYVLPDTVLRVIAREPDEPFYPLYDNRSQRLIVLPTIAARLPRGFSIGIAFNYIAGLGGNVSAQPGATRALEARVDEAIFSHLGVNLGLRWQVNPRLALALVYRQALGVPFSTTSRNDVAGQPIDLDVAAEELYAPHEVVLGGALRLPKRMLASLDVQWSHWSDWRGPFVTVTSQLPLVGEIDATPPRASFSDTFSFRAGLEWTALERARATLLLRGGYGFETQAAPSSQPGVTNLLDGPKHRLAIGAGLRARFGKLEIRADAHGQMDVVQSETLTKKLADPATHPDPAAALVDESGGDPSKPVTTNPGYPSLSSGGFVWAAGFTLTVKR